MQSENGYPVLAPDEVVKWVIPLKSGAVKHFILRPGHAGFLLAHYALFHDEEIERLDTQVVWDDWGYAVRNVRGSDTVVSNHSSGTAIDVNATRHPLSVRNTYTAEQMRRIRFRLKVMFNVLRWGGDYHNRADEMHFEIYKSLRAVRYMARIMRGTPRGRRIMKANPHYKIKSRT